MCVNHNKQNLPMFFKVRTINGKTTLVEICSSKILHTGIKVRFHVHRLHHPTLCMIDKTRTIQNEQIFHILYKFLHVFILTISYKIKVEEPVIAHLVFNLTSKVDKTRGSAH